MTDAWSARLSEYIDGELDASTYRALEEHLRDCLSCRQELEGLRRVVGRLDGAAPGGPSRALWPALEDRLAATERERPAPDVLPFRQAAPARVSWAPVAAAAALIFVGIVWLAGRSGPEPGGDSLPGLPRAAAPATDGPVAAVDRYREVAASWQQLLDDVALPADIQDAVRRDLEAFDRAFRDVTVALEESPGDEELERYLIHMLGAKASYLMRVRKSMETLS